MGWRGAVPGPWVLGMGLARSRGRARVGLASVVVSRRVNHGVNGPNPAKPRKLLRKPFLSPRVTSLVLRRLRVWYALPRGRAGMRQRQRPATRGDVGIRAQRCGKRTHTAVRQVRRLSRRRTQRRAGLSKSRENTSDLTAAPQITRQKTDSSKIHQTAGTVHRSTTALAPAVLERTYSTRGAPTPIMCSPTRERAWLQ